jgi:hypothetical protein
MSIEIGRTTGAQDCQETPQSRGCLLILNQLLGHGRNPLEITDRQRNYPSLKCGTQLAHRSA